MIAIDTAKPIIARVDAIGGKVLARVHDHMSPSRAHDWQRVWIDDDGKETTMTWYGEYLWRADVTPGARFRVCARDRRGNEACSDMGVTGDGATMPDGGGEIPSGEPGGCCDTRGASTNALFALALLVVLRRRRQSDRNGGQSAEKQCTRHCYASCP